MFGKIFEGIIAIGAIKLAEGIFKVRKEVPIFKVPDEEGKSIVVGSLEKCRTFIKAEEITGEMLPEGRDFGTAKIDGEDYYPINYVGVEEKKSYFPVVVGVGIILLGITGKCVYDKWKKKNFIEVKKK